MIFDWKEKKKKRICINLVLSSICEIKIHEFLIRFYNKKKIYFNKIKIMEIDLSFYIEIEIIDRNDKLWVWKKRRMEQRLEENRENYFDDKLWEKKKKKEKMLMDLVLLQLTAT